MNEGELGGRIARYLDAAVEDLDPRILRRLRAGREAALERVRESEVAPEVAWSTSGPAARLSGAGDPGGARVLIPAALLLMALIGLSLWQETRLRPEATDELELLSDDDLPLNAYLDKGFQQWISGSLRR